jgi:hypothetical protein
MRFTAKNISIFGQDVAERYGGFIVSFCILVVLFSYLLTSKLPEIRDVVVRQISIILRPPAPQATPEPPSLAAMFPPAATTRVDEVKPKPPEETKREDEAKPPEKSAPYSVRRINEAMLRALEEDKKELVMQEKELEQEKDMLRNKIDELAARERGRKFMASTEGIEDGAARRLVLSDYPQSIVDRILERYNIRISIRYISADKASTYLNLAETRKGTYYSRPGSGIYEVFQLSRKAVTKMVGLEIEEMKRRGLDPNRTRVIEVHFGIVKRGDDYDLGIMKFKAEEIE